MSTGKEKSFTTGVNIPYVYLEDVDEVTDKGFYRGKTYDPVSYGTKIEAGSGIGEFSAGLAGLEPGVRYYIMKLMEIQFVA